MKTADLTLIQQINKLWKPVYPYLAKHIEEIYGRRDGVLLEIGPFSGVVFSLMKDRVGDAHAIASFPTGMAESYLQEARDAGVAGRIQIIESDNSLSGIEDASVDLAVFRGAFFFPDIFGADLLSVDRTLRPGGVAFVGGGFGKYTPNSLLLDLGKQSRELNLSIGKIEMTEQSLRKLLTDSQLRSRSSISDEGGLWVIIRK